QQSELQQQQKALADNKGLSDEDRKAQQTFLDKELQSNKDFLALAQANAGLKESLTYMDGYANYLAGNYSAAHKDLEQLKNDNPQYAPNPALNVDQLLDEAQGGISVWYYRNKQAIKKGLVIGAAVVAAVGAAAATFYTGPGAALAATGAFGAVMAGGGAILAGTAAGTI